MKRITLYVVLSLLVGTSLAMTPVSAPRRPAFAAAGDTRISRSDLLAERAALRVARSYQRPAPPAVRPRPARKTAKKPTTTRRYATLRYASAHAWALTNRAVSGCESSNRLTAVSSSGKYRGKWQFDYTTWRAHGGIGDPAAASEAVQDAVAFDLFRDRGWSPWPVCGRLGH